MLAQQGGVTDAMLQNPDAADWPMWRRTLNGWGYSPLDQVTADNVTELEEVWSAPLANGIQEATPLIHDGRMYVPNNGDYIQAFDAATGEALWEYRRHPQGQGGGTNRNLAIWGNLIINGSTDNAMYALDADTGELVWETQVLPPRAPARASSGPIIADGRVITGRQCQPQATHEACIITAHDAATGEELWRTRTIPRPGEAGDETWGDVPLDERWHVGTWMVPSYDAELGLIYIGTSVTIPAPKFLLGGVDLEHLYHNSTLALDVETGEIVWYYQHVNDHWDLDHPFERILVDTAVAPNPDEVAWINPALSPGEQRRVITGVPGKTGLVYTLDRETGEFLWARPTITQNVIADIDGATGSVTVNRDVIFTRGDQALTICPGTTGGKNFPAGAYSPRTNAIYMPMQHLCMDATMRTSERDPSLVYGFGSEQILAPGTENVGVIYAVSVETGETLWRHEQRAGQMSLLATGGGLIFGGDVAGQFKAFDESTGDVLWQADLGMQIGGYPVSFAVDGKQYIAAPTGQSLVGASTRRLTPELPDETAGPRVVVFALP
ncbi:MAG: PQQ-binding-like beta-propeller repeat protein [Gammaproteobacteria bacterium]|nr:PQQ-binding-like beta-propeller repeat protein [Gammaproteobacteria bacterium]